MPAFDGGARDASSVVDGSGGDPIRRDGGAQLPSADREVVLAMGEAPVTIRYEIDARPAVLDVHLAVDTTSSFIEEIDAVKRSLVDDVIPAIRSYVPDSAFGISYFQDFPAYPFGLDTDRPFVLLQRITSDVMAVSRAAERLDERIGNGGDIPESGFESIFQVATGLGYQGGGLVIPRFAGGAAVGGGESGGVGFRENSFRVLVHATDAVSHDAISYLDVYPGVHGRSAALDALVSSHIFFVGITNGGPPRMQLEPFAISTGAFVAPSAGVCPTGVLGTARAPTAGVCPLVFDILPDGTGLSDALQAAVASLVSSIDYDRVTGIVGEDRLDFVEGIAAVSAMPTPGVAAPTIEDSTPGDSLPDTFRAVRSGTRLVFEVSLRNEDFPSASYEQSFRVRVEVVAGGTKLVEEWIRVVVPATSP